MSVLCQYTGKYFYTNILTFRNLDKKVCRMSVDLQKKFEAHVLRNRT